MAIDESVDRRRFLALLGSGTAVGLAGCGGAGGQPTYEEGEADPPDDAEERTPQELIAAQGMAEQEARQDAAPLDVLSLVEHEFAFEGGAQGSTVQGTVENRGEEPIQFTEVRVRVYDENGNMLDRYLASTGDFASGTSWAFTVVLLEAPGDIASYDIAVVGLAA